MRVHSPKVYGSEKLVRGLLANDLNEAVVSALICTELEAVAPLLLIAEEVAGEEFEDERGDWNVGRRFDFLDVGACGT